MRQYKTFEERYRYLKLEGIVGKETFGFDRYINQRFYKSRQWLHTRNAVITRDLGRDLGMEGYEIVSRLLVHHMNPITPEDIVDGLEKILQPEYLVCVSHRTHNAIHYGDESLLEKPIVERHPGDTKLW